MSNHFKDQLKSGRPLQSGIGMSMLQNMGWTPGEGLGRQQNGALTPILPEIKLNRKGTAYLLNFNSLRKIVCEIILPIKVLD